MKWLVFSFFFALSVNVFSHPFYVSIFTVNYDEPSQSLQITIKVFSDDLEEGIKQSIEKGFKLEAANADKIISEYIDQSFSIFIDEIALKTKFLGIENENDVTYAFLEISNLSPPKQLDFSTTFLTDIFQDQSNIFHFTYGDFKESFILNKGLSKLTLTINNQ